ncbi:hypothetical protein TF1A_0042 [Chrysodeixis chalcites SNPV TF1-A]|uniref:Uncharacterized protein n=1 Tax=Chrysodeixis chalcites nucleopolyhedrovirus TaxID=320432 RepID=T1R068_9ABAC|nr:hypothetical protein TF1A_0042 [Chrysodeixis chalcites SNPV TF1-A]AGE61453.1 hypothetical protein [Chrysodeixis chalcites nucleopolyhedrovirus]
MDRRSSKRASETPLSPPPSSSSSSSSILGFRKSSKTDGSAKKKLKSTTKPPPATAISTATSSVEAEMEMDIDRSMMIDEEQQRIQHIRQMEEAEKHIMRRQNEMSRTIQLSQDPTTLPAASLTTAVSSVIDMNKRQRTEGSNSSPVVVFITPPLLNQIPSDCNNMLCIQKSIDSIKLYLDALQNNINSRVSNTLKQFLTFEDNIENVIDYATIMNAILSDKDVSRKNFYKFSEALFNYYVRIFDNVSTVAHVIVNVNYTRGKTKITHGITNFFNLCVNYIVSNITDLLEYKESRLPYDYIHPDEYRNHIDNYQRKLTDMYNYRLLDLLSIIFYKHTPDNDVNQFTSVAATNKYYRVIDIDIHVKNVYNYLVFE